MFLPLDGPGLETNKSVTDTPQIVKVGANSLEERKVVTIQPTDGHIWYGYTNAVSSTTGTKIFKNQTFPLEAGEELDVYIVAAPGETVDVRITEVA